MQVQPYLFFDGRCEEALDFYKGAVGAKVSMLMRYKEAPDKSMLKAGTEEKVMHAQFQVGDTSILASDGHCNGNTNFQGFSLAISAKTEAEAEKMFNALSSLVIASASSGCSPIRFRKAFSSSWAPETWATTGACSGFGFGSGWLDCIRCSPLKLLQPFLRR